MELPKIVYHTKSFEQYSVDDLFKSHGYQYKPHNGPSGRPRYFRDTKNPVGIIFFFTHDGGYNLLVRQVVTQFLEDVTDEIITYDQLIIKLDQLKSIQ